ncbi:MAG: peptide chain release factor N(5)-glutamine methyltransferase [Sediminibacterium sp.]
MSLHDTKQALKQKMSHKFEAIELNSLLAILIEHVTGWNQVNQAVNKDKELTPIQLTTLNTYTDELIAGKPIQYIIGKSWFMGEEYLVNENVLIPRPETEELVEWIVEYASIINKPLKIIDIGTGSGCIAIALKKSLPTCALTGLDISSAALIVAKENGEQLNAQVEWIQEDILMSASLPDTYDIMVSNPPYIPIRELADMQEQVKDYEPNIALFVLNEDPLVFYKAIARLGKQCLSINGQLFFEIHFDQGKNILALLDEMGYHAELRQDMFGKNRMVRASLKNKNSR